MMRTRTIKWTTSTRSSMRLPPHAWVEAFAERGRRVEFERIRRLIGKGGDKLLDEIADLAAESPEGKAIEERRREIFLTRYAPHLRPCRGARALLERLRG